MSCIKRSVTIKKNDMSFKISGCVVSRRSTVPSGPLEPAKSLNIDKLNTLYLSDNLNEYITKFNEYIATNYTVSKNVTLREKDMPLIQKTATHYNIYNIIKNWKLYYTSGNNNDCAIHSFLTVTLENFRKINDDDRNKFATHFRRNVLRFNKQIGFSDKDYSELLNNYMLTDSLITSLAQYFKLNIMIVDYTTPATSFITRINQFGIITDPYYVISHTSNVHWEAMSDDKNNFRIDSAVIEEISRIIELDTATIECPFRNDQRIIVDPGAQLYNINNELEEVIKDRQYIIINRYSDKMKCVTLSILPIDTLTALGRTTTEEYIKWRDAAIKATDPLIVTGNILTNNTKDHKDMRYVKRDNSDNFGIRLVLGGGKRKKQTRKRK